MKIIKRIFDDPLTDPFEVMLRHIMCIFMAIEAMFICGIIIMLIDIDTDTDTIILLKYHEEPLSIILFPFMLCVFFIGMTLLSFFHRPVYLIYEGLHVLIGLILIHAVFILIILSTRLAVYLIIMEIHNTKIKKRSRQNKADNEQIL